MRGILLAGAFIILGSAPAARADLTVPIPLTVSGNVAQGSVGLPGISLDLTVTFENVVGLTSGALEASATLVNPFDPAVLGRLPPLLKVPLALPVVLHVGPSATSALSFSGAYTISFHTHNLSLDALHLYSLVKSPDGGAFADITRSEGIGSYRDDGSGGDFSDFLIALDLRPINPVINGKFNSLQDLLDDNEGSMSPETASALQAFLTQALALYNQGSISAASDQVKAFSDYVKAHSGEEIPDVWRAGCGTIVNVAGLLRSSADTLKFSLDRKASH